MHRDRDGRFFLGRPGEAGTHIYTFSLVIRKNRTSAVTSRSHFFPPDSPAARYPDISPIARILVSETVVGAQKLARFALVCKQWLSDRQAECYSCGDIFRLEPQRKITFWVAISDER